MHLIEKYAASCGVKITKPEIYQMYMPIPFDKYILFYPSNSKTSADYDHWQIVIDAIFDFIKNKGISIIQISNKNAKKYNNCAFLDEESINFNNLSYLIKNSELILGVDGINNHIASSFNKKIVSLYYNTNINNVKPYWGEKSNQILIEPKIESKPYYGNNKIYKTSNLIKPEEVIESILYLLNIKYNQMIKTLFIGNNFHNKNLEIIPDGEINISNIEAETLIIRMDLSFNEEALEKILPNKKCIIFTNKNLNLNLIKKYKNNIFKIIYFLTEDNDVNFIKKIKSFNIEYTLVSESSDELINKYKIKYMDYGLIFKKEKNKINFEIPKDKKVFFRSSKIYLSSKGIYNTKYGWINNINNFQEIIDNELFWEDLNDLYIFTIDNS
jgi:hypothetical protein